MAGHQFLNREQVIAMQEVIQTIGDLLGEESERLGRAQRDVVGRSLPEFVFAMVVSELTKVVAAQQERIEQLEKALANRKPRAGNPAKK